MDIAHELTKLPLHYYLGTKKLEIRLSPDNQTYIDHRSNTINIGEAMLRDTFKENLKESDIRSMLYHEVSHAILTKVSYKKDLCDRIGKGINDEVLGFANTFEDERIETLLNGYYKDVNFEKQKRYVCFGGFENYHNKNILNQISLTNFNNFMLRAIRLRRDKDNLGYFRQLANEKGDVALVSRINELHKSINQYFAIDLMDKKNFFSSGVDDDNRIYEKYLDTLENIYKEGKEIFKELKEIQKEKEKDGPDGPKGPEGQEGQGQSGGKTKIKASKNKDENTEEMDPKDIPDDAEIEYDDEEDGEENENEDKGKDEKSGVSPNEDEETEENAKGGSSSPDEPEQDETESEGEEKGEDHAEGDEELSDEEKEAEMNKALNDMEKEGNSLEENSKDEIADEKQAKNEKDKEHLKKRAYLLGNLINDGTLKEEEIDPMVINFNPYISLKEKFMPTNLKGNYIRRNNLGEGEIDPTKIEKMPNSKHWRDYTVFRQKSKFGIEKGIGGKKHINFIIDSSGSYGSNVQATYEVLKQFEEAFKNHPLVTYDIYICACGIRQVKNPDEYMSKQHYCNGGNGLTRVDLPILDKIDKQSHQKGNFNVVLFDGSMCNNGTRKIDEKGRTIECAGEGISYSDTKADYHYTTKLLHNAYAILDEDFYRELKSYEPEFTSRNDKNYVIHSWDSKKSYPEMLKGQMYRIIEKIAVADNSLKKQILDPKFKRKKIIEITR